MSIFLLSILALGMIACSKGGSSSSAAAASNTDACLTTGSTVIISGTVNFERAPFSSTLGASLDFNNIQIQPVRSSEIQALGADDYLISTPATSLTDTYSLVVNANQDERKHDELRHLSLILVKSMQVQIL
jgi:hypothetical protein